MEQPIVEYFYDQYTDEGSIMISNISNNYDRELYRSDVIKVLRDHNICSHIYIGNLGSYPGQLHFTIIEDIFDILEEIPIETISLCSENFHFNELEMLTILLNKIYNSQLVHDFRKLVWYVWNGPPIDISEEYFDGLAAAVAKFGLIKPSRIPEIHIRDWGDPDVTLNIQTFIDKKIAENKQNKGNLNTVINTVVNGAKLPSLPEEIWLIIGRLASGIDSRGTFRVNPNTYFSKK